MDQSSNALGASVVDPDTLDIVNNYFTEKHNQLFIFRI